MQHTELHIRLRDNMTTRALCNPTAMGYGTLLTAIHNTIPHTPEGAHMDCTTGLQQALNRDTPHPKETLNLSITLTL